jgi:mono/diheme cytochrome c family protein
VTARLPIACLLALAAAGCGGAKASPTETSGAGLFSSVGCSNCHTLKAAHAVGHVGPNLDQLKPSVAQVTKQVTNGGGGMPAFRGTLSPAQITAVANYVASSAGKS